MAGPGARSGDRRTSRNGPKPRMEQAPTSVYEPKAEIIDLNQEANPALSLLLILPRRISTTRKLHMPTRTTFPLSSIAAVSLFTIVAVPSVALAQVAAQERVVAACTSDVRSFCGQSHDERQACIKTRFREFSLPCQLAMVKYGTLKRDCSRDVRKHCVGISPGSGRIEACIKDNFEKLRPECKLTILQAGGKGS